MRKVAVIADVHGNAPALAAVLEEVEREQADLIVSCGDLTWGPLPDETYELARGLNARFVRGNADRAVLEGVSETEREQWMQSHHTDSDAGVPRHVRGERRRRGRRAWSRALLPRLAAQRRGVRHPRDARGAGPRAQRRRRRDRDRQRPRPHPVRPRSGRDPQCERRQRRPPVRGPAGRVLGAARAGRGAAPHRIRRRAGPSSASGRAGSRTSSRSSR